MLGLDALLDSGFWKHRFYQPEERRWQSVLFQPVGGMDQIVRGFLRQIGRLIQYQSVVTGIRLLEDGVEVTYRDSRGRALRTQADYCISNMPLPVLQKTPANFSHGFKTAVDRCRFEPSCKVGWQANERFWESDKYQIHGGISHIDHIIGEMWYPSSDCFTKKGILTGAYNFGKRGRQFGEMSLERRLTVAREGAMKLHPEFGSDRIVPRALGLSIAWQNVPFQSGGWADWDGDEEEDRKAYTRLLAPDGRFHVVGDQVSPLESWQEGAMMSAEHVIEQIAGMRPTSVPEILEAPRSRGMTQDR
jgi:monoamine oxidase